MCHATLVGAPPSRSPSGKRSHSSSPQITTADIDSDRLSVESTLMESYGVDDVYGGSLALLTDLYQLSMACGYWKAGTAEREAVFHLTFRRAPFGGGYAIAAGM